MKLTVLQLAERLGAELVGGDGGGEITAVAGVEAAGASDVTFAADSKRTAVVRDCGAGAVIVGRRVEGLAMPQLVVKNVNAALVEALNVFAPKLKRAVAGIDSSAKVCADAKISSSASIGPGVVIDDGVQIGAGSVIGSGCWIGQNSKLGENCRLDSNVVIYHNCTIGNNVVIQANTTVGSTGFGYVCIDGSHRLIPHNGTVVIEDFVEIGANCCIDRAKFDNTVIGAGTKIDNLVQIGHNVILGKCCLIVAQVGISGSCRIGDGVVLGGQVGLADNIKIGDGAMIGAKSGVHQNVAAGQQMSGTPAYEKREAFKIMGSMRRLPKLVQQLKQLSKKIEKLEEAED